MKKTLKKSTKTIRKNPLVTFEKRAIRNTIRFEKKAVRAVKKNYFYAGAAASATLLATAVGLGIYLLSKKRDSRKVAFQKMKFKVLREIENTGEKLSDEIRHLKNNH
jgi:hypothetical protein